MHLAIEERFRKCDRDSSRLADNDFANAAQQGDNKASSPTIESREYAEKLARGKRDHPRRVRPRE